MGPGQISRDEEKQDDGRHDSESGNENKLIVTLISLLVNWMPSGRGKPIRGIHGVQGSKSHKSNKCCKKAFLEKHKIQCLGHFLGVSVVFLSSCSEELHHTKHDLEPDCQLAQIAPFPLMAAELPQLVPAEASAVSLTHVSLCLCFSFL